MMISSTTATCFSSLPSNSLVVTYSKEVLNNGMRLARESLSSPEKQVGSWLEVLSIQGSPVALLCREPGSTRHTATSSLQLDKLSPSLTPGTHPLVGHKLGAGLEHAEDLSVHVLQPRRVAGGLDGVRAVKGVGLEGQLQKVAAHHLALLSQPRLQGMVNKAQTLVQIFPPALAPPFPFLELGCFHLPLPRLSHVWAFPAGGSFLAALRSE